MFEFIVRYGRKTASYQRERAAVRELSALDDRMLKDLGLSRCRFASVATDFDPERR